MTGQREADLLEAANLLLDARRTLTPLAQLPANLKPTTMAEVYFVQDTIAIAYGAIGGWKVGASSPDAIPLAAPMPAAWMASSGATISGHRFRGLEAEVAFLLKSDLPPRSAPYTDDEVYAAVASCHPAIEVLESGLTDPTTAPKMAMLADLQMHGGFIHGPATPAWPSIDFSKEHVALIVSGAVRVERTGSNTAGNLLRLLPWLANEGAARTGGLRAGQWITTGSWTGNTTAITGASVNAEFTNVGRVDVRFA